MLYDFDVAWRFYEKCYNFDDKFNWNDWSQIFICLLSPVWSILELELTCVFLFLISHENFFFMYYNINRLCLLNYYCLRIDVDAHEVIGIISASAWRNKISYASRNTLYFLLNICADIQLYSQTKLCVILVSHHLSACMNEKWWGWVIILRFTIYCLYVYAQ